MKKYCALLFSLFILFPVAFSVLGCPTSEKTPDPGPENPRPPRPPRPPQTVFYYSEYGAVGDGVTCDFDAIIATHEAANEKGASVSADAGATYYIGNAQKTAVIKTDTDWSGANFIIDDSDIQFTERPLVVNGVARPGFMERVWEDSWIFNIAPTHEPYRDDTLFSTLKKNQSKVDISLPYGAVIFAHNSNVTHYIRRGENANAGTSQQDVFVVDKNGNVDMNAPIIWDFNAVTRIDVYPMDDKTITVRGGNFRSINNTGDSDDRYMMRGIYITRSNTVIDGVFHDIEGEGVQGASYYGFLFLEYCANVKVQNCTLTGHKAYHRPSATSTRRGSYDMQVNRTVNVSVINCDQTNDIVLRDYYGIFASNFSKNIIFDGVKFSRFDAHMGVYNTTIKNSELGYMGVSIIGSGLLLIENTTVTGENFIYFRDDYGSSWEGDLIIRNCVFNAIASQTNNQYNPSIIHTNNDGQHNFGYPTFMPETITFENFTVVEPSNATAGILMFRLATHNTNAPRPFTWTKELNISGFSATSGRKYQLTGPARTSWPALNQDTITRFTNQITVNE